MRGESDLWLPGDYLDADEHEKSGLPRNIFGFPVVASKREYESPEPPGPVVLPEELSGLWVSRFWDEADGCFRNEHGSCYSPEMADGTVAGAALEFIESKVGFCGCGMPGEALEWLVGVLRILSVHPADDSWTPAWERVRPSFTTDGECFAVLYWLDHLGLAEHGGSVYGSYLSDLGERILGDLTVLLKEESL
jgi:hypothetical protein